MLRRATAAALLIAWCLQGGAAQAHWCDDLWASSYNLVVQPDSDSVAIPQGGTASLRLHVQNNMAYPLPDFSLQASADGYLIQASMGQTKVRGMLMPGERVDVLLDISGTTGAPLAPRDLTFHVHFGEGRQADRYPTAPGRAAAIVGVDGGVSFAGDGDPFPGIGTGNAEARDLQYAAVADFGNPPQGFDSLLQFYCAGRASWDHASEHVLSSFCLDVEQTQCPGRASFGEGEHTTLYDWPKLWAAEHLAARKVAASARLSVFRQRLMCGYADDNPAFRDMAALLLGYLGEDSAARGFLEDQLRASTGGDQQVVEAALLLMGNPEDKIRYGDDVRLGADAEDTYVAGACAAVLGIVDGDDRAVQEILMKRATWTEPELADNGRGFYNAHLLALVALHRSHWAPGSGGASYASFFLGDTIEQPASSGPMATPSGPGASGCSCSVGRPARGGSALLVLPILLLGCAWRFRGTSCAAVALVPAILLCCPCSSPERRAQHFNDYAGDADSQPEEVMGRLGIAPGMRIADIGAGGGYFTLRMARAAGHTGKVFAVDIDAGLLSVIEHASSKAGLDNVQTVLASEDDSRLPEAVDLVFMRDTFHHLREPTAYFRKLATRLRPGARVAIIDYRPKGLWASLFGHHASQSVIERDLVSAGYAIDRSYDFLARQCFVIFRQSISPQVAVSPTGFERNLWRSP